MWGEYVDNINVFFRTWWVRFIDIYKYRGISFIVILYEYRKWNCKMYFVLLYNFILLYMYILVRRLFLISVYYF